MDGSVSRYMSNNEPGSVVTRTELAMIRAIEAFSRWCVFLHSSTCDERLSAQDVWLLHSIRMRGGAQNLSELLLFLNRNDVSTIQYSLRKIEQAGLIERITGNSRREAGYRMTPKGLEVTGAYARLRESLLIELVAEVAGMERGLETAAGALERLTGLYDQATQAVLNQKILGASPPPSADV